MLHMYIKQPIYPILTQMMKYLLAQTVQMYSQQNRDIWWMWQSRVDFNGP